MNIIPKERSFYLGIAVIILSAISFYPDGIPVAFFWIIGGLIGLLAGVLIADDSNNYRRWAGFIVVSVIWVSALIAAYDWDAHTWHLLNLRLLQSTLVFFATSFPMAYRFNATPTKTVEEQK